MTSLGRVIRWAASLPVPTPYRIGIIEGAEAALRTETPRLWLSENAFMRRHGGRFGGTSVARKRNSPAGSSVLLVDSGKNGDGTFWFFRQEITRVKDVGAPMDGPDDVFEIRETFRNPQVQDGTSVKTYRVNSNGRRLDVGPR